MKGIIMKILTNAVILSLALLSANVYAMEDMPMPASKMQSAKPIESKGVVMGISKESGSVTLKHEAIPAIEWPPMTMSFKVKDKKSIEKIKAGDKVDFTLVKQGADYMIDTIK
jgi:Cu(I)/Ag(I) efflux system periplasmic protein CusF